MPPGWAGTGWAEAAGDRHAMLIDARRFAGQVVQAGICIVGAGMGGIAAGRALVEAGLDVLFVEAGGEHPTAPAPILHEEAGLPFRLPRTRAIALGGGAHLWHGVCAPFDPIDFEARPWIPGSGWPIAAARLAGPYAEAARWLGLGSEPPDLPSAPVGAGALLEPRLFRVSPMPTASRDQLLRWVREGRARCLLHAVGLAFRPIDGEGRARRLLIGCGDGTAEIEAGLFILAAGALETPRLLLNSARAGAGIGGAAATGRYLMDHPAGYFSQAVFRRPERGWFGAAGPSAGGPGAFLGLALRREVQARFGLPNHHLFLRPGAGAGRVPAGALRGFVGVKRARDLSPRQVLAIAAHPYIVARIARERLGLRAPTRHADLYVMAEQVPNPESRVMLSPDRVDRYGYPVARIAWRMTAEEWAHAGRYVALVAEALGADPRIDHLRVDALADWPEALASSAHHMGTARMAGSAAEGVVDTDLRVFGTRNLFVCDASVLPTAGGVNPTLTIAALGLRLGGFLRREGASLGGAARAA